MEEKQQVQWRQLPGGPAERVPCALTQQSILLATDSLDKLFYPGGFVTISVAFGDSQPGSPPDLSSAGLADSARLSHWHSTSQPHMEPLCSEPLAPPVLLSQWAASPPTSHPDPSLPLTHTASPVSSMYHHRSIAPFSLIPTAITRTPLASPGLPASSHCPEFIKTMASGPSLWMRECSGP